VFLEVKPHVAFEVSFIHHMGSHPLEYLDAIIVGGGEVMFQSQSVSYRDYDCTHRHCHLKSEVVKLRKRRRGEDTYGCTFGCIGSTTSGFSYWGPSTIILLNEKLFVGGSPTLRFFSMRHSAIY
jgi:hypothetical protein